MASFQERLDPNYPGSSPTEWYLEEYIQYVIAALPPARAIPLPQKPATPAVETPPPTTPRRKLEFLLYPDS